MLSAPKLSESKPKSRRSASVKCHSLSKMLDVHRRWGPLRWAAHCICLCRESSVWHAVAALAVEQIQTCSSGGKYDLAWRVLNNAICCDALAYWFAVCGHDIMFHYIYRCFKTRGLVNRGFVIFQKIPCIFINFQICVSCANWGYSFLFGSTWGRQLDQTSWNINDLGYHWLYL